MQTKFEYYFFTKAYSLIGDIKWYCHTTIFKLTVGTINYDRLFNKYVFIPYGKTGYSALCLDEISKFITLLDLD